MGSAKANTLKPGRVPNSEIHLKTVTSYYGGKEGCEQEE